MMKLVLKIGIALLMLNSIAFGFVDSDFDGVSDRYDACPNTPFSDLVDEKGCSIKKVAIKETKKNLTLIVGLNFDNYKDRYGNKTTTKSESFEVDYQIERTKLYLNISQFNTKNKPLSQYDDSSFADSRLGISYSLEQDFKGIYFDIGAGIALPNYKGTLHNNKTDLFFTLDANYNLEEYSLFSSYIYTIIGDEDVEGLRYQNTSALTLGLGRALYPDSYTSAALYFSQPIIKGEKNIKSFSIYHYQNIDKSIFSIINYTHGLTSGETDNSFGLQLGYRL